MKSSLYIFSILLIGLGNAAASAGFLQFLKDSTFPRFSFTGGREDLAVVDEALRTIRHSTKATRTVLAYTARRRPVNAYFFPGTSTEYALVIGGMHGSELSSIEVAKAVVDSLSADRHPYYNVVVIPALFPDNAVRAANFPEEIGSFKNIGRYTSEVSADPNRQMPALGSPFLPDHPVDFAGRTIERENQALLHLIGNLNPQRIASIHAIRKTEMAGIFADPRTDGYGYAEGFVADSMLAVQMARQIAQLGGTAPGNNLNTLPSALYCTDPPVVPKGELQKRTVHGSNSSHHRGYGISLGSWASTSERVYEESLIPRTAAIMLTVEFPGSKRTMDHTQPAEKLACHRNVQAYASAIVSVMLQQGPTGK